MDKLTVTSRLICYAPLFACLNWIHVPEIALYPPVIVLLIPTPAGHLEKCNLKSGRLVLSCPSIKGGLQVGK